MVHKNRSGAVISSNFYSASAVPKSVINATESLVLGQISEVLYLDHPRNISKRFVEYDVLINDQDLTRSQVRNCRAIDSYGDDVNFNEAVLNPTTYARQGDKGDANGYIWKNGAIVLLGFLNGKKNAPIILGGLQHPGIDLLRATPLVDPIASASPSIDDRLKELPTLTPGSKAPPGVTYSSQSGSMTSSSQSSSQGVSGQPVVPSAPSPASLIGALTALNASLSLSAPALSLKLPAMFGPPTSLTSLMTRKEAIDAAPNALQSRIAAATSKSSAVIPSASLGSNVPSTTATSASSISTENDGQRILGEFNGLRWNVNPFGELTVMFQGLKNTKGNIVDTTVEPTIMKFNKDGEFFVIDNLDQEIKISRKDWQITICDGQTIPNKITIDRLFNRITIESPLDVQVISPNYIGSHDRTMITGSEVKLGGKDADQQAVLGNEFMKLYNTLVDMVLKHKHTGVSAGLVTTGTYDPLTTPIPPDNMTSPKHLSQNVKIDKSFSGKPDLS